MNPDNSFIYEDEEGPSKEERVLGAICYAPFGFAAPLLMQKQSDFLSLHTRQGGIIFWAYFVFLFFLVFLPFGGFFLFGISSLAYLGLGGFAAWRAYNGEKLSYGFIESLLEKVNKQ